MPLPYQHVYLPDFPAWAFVRSKAVRAVAVQERDRVVACTAAARRAGVFPGMRAARVPEVGPGVRLVLRDGGLEAAAWEGALEALHALTPYLEPVAPGRVVLQQADAADLAAFASSRGACVGVGTSRAVAQLAALRSAPGHVLDVAPAHVPGFLSRAAVGLLAGAGFESGLIERLSVLGYTTLGRAATLTKRHLRAQFGDEGGQLYALLHPPRTEAPVTPFTLPLTLLGAVDLDEPVREPREALPVVRVLATEASRGLGRVLCRRVTVRVSGRGRVLEETRVLPVASADSGYLVRTAETLAVGLLDGGAVDRMEVALAGLQTAAVTQGGLFERRPPLYLAARGVHRRFPGAARRALVTVTALFPEDRVRWEPYPDQAAA